MNHHHHSQAVPPLDAATIDHMEHLFPARSPDPRDDDREIWMKAGEARAVRHMRNLLEKQERNGTVFPGGIRI